MDIGQVLQGLVGLSFDIISILFKFFIAFLAASTAFSKRRSGLFWGIITFLFPWTYLILLFLPRKYPRFTSSLNNKAEFRGKNPVVSSIMALSAMIAKSDGSVSREEVNIIKRFVATNFRMSQEELKTYGEVFDYGKNHPEEYKQFAQVITTYFRRRDQIIAISYLFVSIGIHDGIMTAAEEDKIKSILFAIGVSEYEYNSIKSSFTNGGGSYYQNRQSARQESGSLIKKYSKVLGVSEDATMSEIKTAYRKLVKEYHPDKMAAQGMPEEYEEFANNKVAEINEAYEYLKKVKE